MQSRSLIDKVGYWCLWLYVYMHTCAFHYETALYSLWGGMGAGEMPQWIKVFCRKSRFSFQYPNLVTQLHVSLAPGCNLTFSITCTHTMHVSHRHIHIQINKIFQTWKAAFWNVAEEHVTSVLVISGIPSRYLRTSSKADPISVHRWVYDTKYGQNKTPFSWSSGF